jgi:6-phosphofructokinase
MECRALTTNPKRIAINVGNGFVPGLNSIILGAAVAAKRLGWEVVGIRDGFDGLLHPEHYPSGGLVPIGSEQIENIDPIAGNILSQSKKFDPFHVRQVSDDSFVDEVDLSDQVLETLESEGVDALISIVGTRGMSIIHKLQRKGLNAICIPRSVENDIEATRVSFGFNTALSFTIDMLDRTRQAAQSARQIAVVEVLGNQSGWLALRAGIAAGADAVIIPEISADMDVIADQLKERINPDRPCGLVVVAAGANIATAEPEQDEKVSALRASLSPSASGGAVQNAIRPSGQAANLVAQRLQMLLAVETYPLVLGNWSRGGTPTAVDRQLGMIYGAGAIRALETGSTGTMLAFQPPDIKAVPLAQAINKVRTVPLESDVIKVARTLGICLGDSSNG